MKDIFNKQKIKELSQEIQILRNRIGVLGSKVWFLEKNRCYKIGNTIPEDSVLSYMGNHLRAIEDFLNLEVQWHWEDSLDYLESPRPQIKKWKAVKKVNLHKH
jgi:hypothetical protein